MAVANTVRREIAPTHPGEVLREDFMPDFRLTRASLSKALGVSRQTVNELVREKRSVTSLMALRLSRLFGNSPEFWLNAQHERDLWEEEKLHQHELEKIHPLDSAGKFCQEPPV